MFSDRDSDPIGLAGRRVSGDESPTARIGECDAIVSTPSDTPKRVTRWVIRIAGMHELGATCGPVPDSYRAPAPVTSHVIDGRSPVF